MVQRVAELQEMVWNCEERIQYLESTNAGMADDLVQKSELIDHYSMRGLRDGGGSDPVIELTCIAFSRLTLKRRYVAWSKKKENT